MFRDEIGVSPPRAVTEVTSIYGPLAAYADDVITRQIEKFGNHTRPEFAFATAILDRGMTVFDGGAHIGTFALAAAHKVGRLGRVLCVEGDPETFRLLQQNVRRNAEAQVVCENLFLGSPGAYVPRREAGNSGATHLAAGEGGAGPQAAAPMVSLDDLVARRFAPDFLKLDIEGFEFAALSTSRWFRAARPMLYLEVAPQQLERAGASVEALDALLAELGYAIFVNRGPRNGRHDFFRAVRLQRLAGGEAFFDALCFPKGSRPARALTAVCKGV